MKVGPAARATLALLALAGLAATAATSDGGPLAELAAARRAALLAAGFAPRAIGGDEDRVVWLEAGDGPPLLFLHGVGDQGSSWAAVAPGFEDGHRVIALDLPGHGESEPRTAAILSMATVVGGAERILAEVAAEQPATLVGNSMGAWIATLLAHRHPDRVERIVLVSGGALPGDPTAPSLLPRTREQAAYLMSRLRDSGSPPLSDQILDDLVRRAPNGPTARMTRDLPSLVDHLLVGRLGEVTTPVDLLWGESDRLLPLAYAERMAAELPAARLTRIERCGHVPQLECPERFAAALAALLAAPPPTAADRTSAP